jgi:hypothetical protein
VPGLFLFGASGTLADISLIMKNADASPPIEGRGWRLWITLQHEPARLKAQTAAKLPTAFKRFALRDNLKNYPLMQMKTGSRYYL